MVATPKRIQRRRTKGWRLPAGAVCVSRPGKWGNPFVIGGWFKVETGGDVFIWHDGFMWLQCLMPDIYEYRQIKDAQMAADWYRKYVSIYPPKASDLEELRGKDLACWCHLCEAHKDGKPLGTQCPDCAPCHADVQLELANEVRS